MHQSQARSNTGMLKRNLFSLGIFILLSSPAYATKFFVSPDGSDQNSGDSVARPWRSIAKANETLQPGDILQLRAGQYLDDPIKPLRSGTANAKIRYIAFSGETPVLTSNSVNGLKVAFDLSNRSYIEISGISVDGVELRPNARVQAFAEIYNGNYNTIENCVLRYATGWHGIELDQGSNHNIIRNNTIEFVGAYNEPLADGTPRQKGDSIAIKNAFMNLVENNILTHGGHNLLAVYGTNNVIRGNTFDNDWSSEFGAGAGARGVELVGVRNVFDMNEVRGSGKSASGKMKPGQKVEGQGNIVRGNFIYNNVNEAVATTSRNGSVVAKDNHIFHNTFYANGGAAWRVEYFKNGGVDISRNVFKNNILYDTNATPDNVADVSFKLDVAEVQVLSDNIVASNLFYNASSATATIFIKDAGKTIALQQAELNFPAKILANIEVEPTFVTANPDSVDDFQLAFGSRGIDEAAPLTFVKTTGSGKVVNLVDASFFSDGFSMVPGDSIRIDGGPVLSVVKVDYANNQVTLAQVASWVQGAGVTFDYMDAAPDMGAHELASLKRSKLPLAPLID